MNKPLKLAKFLPKALCLSLGLTLMTAVQADKVAAEYYTAPRAQSVYSQNVIYVAEKALPAVVDIYAKEFATVEQPNIDDLIGRISDPTANRTVGSQKVTKLSKAWGGSGVIFDAQNGYLITNAHVADNLTDFMVKLYNGKVVNGKIVGTDPLSDLAVIKIEEPNLTAVRFGDSDNLRIGEQAIAIGNPKFMNNTVSSGVISALNRTVQLYYNVIQIDTPISHGSSGGGLFDINGNLIGITQGGVPEGSNIGWAIPINIVKPVVAQLVKNGKVYRPFLGVKLYDERFFLENGGYVDLHSGVLLGAVGEQGLAAQNGLQKGDIIVEFNHKRVTTINSLKEQLLRVEQGANVPIKIYRNNMLEEKVIVL